MHARPIHSAFRLFLLLAILGCSGVDCAVAQRAREVVGGLLRELLESEIERRDQGETRDRTRREPDREIRPPRAKIDGSAKSRQARGYFQTFANQSQQLSRLLEQQARTTPGVRSQLDEVLQLQARTDFLNQRYAQPQPDRVLSQDIQQLDRDWRSVSYRLGNLPSLSDQCRSTIKRLDEVNRRCCELFDLGPQVNRRELARLADALAAEIHHLERDVEFELRSSPQARSIANQLRRIGARAKLLGDSATDGDTYEILVAEFKRFNNEWTNLQRQLERFSDRHIDRTIEEIHDINRRLHEQLLLPIRIDRSHLKHLINQAGQRITSLTDTFTLTMLAETPDVGGILGSTRTLHEEIEHLQESVARKAPEEELFEHWQVLDSAWKEFDHYTEAVKSGRIRGLRHEISALIEAMRRDLGVQLSFNRREVVQLAAELEGIMEQAYFHAQQWQRRPGARVDDSLIRDLKRFVDDCHHLHEECASRSEREHLARDCRELTQSWTRLRPKLLNCETIDRNALRRISDEATTRLVRLQVMFEN